MIEKYLILDTETTGLSENDEIIEIAIIDNFGNVLLNELIKPTIEIPKDVIKIHGISNEMVEDKKTWIEIKGYVEEILKDNICLIYNKNFDVRMLKQTSKKYEIDFNTNCKFDCVMESFSIYRDDEYYTSLSNAYSYAINKISNDEYNDFKKIAKTTTKHRALGDCFTTLLVSQLLNKNGLFN